MIEALYRQYFHDVFLYLKALSRSEVIAEELTQETFFRAYMNFTVLREKEKAPAWLCRIAQNTYFAWLREQKKNAAWPMDDLGSAAFGDAEDRLVLAKAMEQLAQDECQIIFLHAVSGLRHREIAGIVGMPLNTVLSKYRRGLKKLRQSLEENM